MLRVVVCGSRHYEDEKMVRVVLTGLLEARKGRPFLVLHGGAKGADTIGGKVAKDLGLKVKVFPADWDKHGKGAGPIRNKQMMEKGKPGLVLAFSPSTAVADGTTPGTYDMVTRAAAANIPCYVIATWDIPF